MKWWKVRTRRQLEKKEIQKKARSQKRKEKQPIHEKLKNAIKWKGTRSTTCYSAKHEDFIFIFHSQHKLMLLELLPPLQEVQMACSIQLTDCTVHLAVSLPVGIKVVHAVDSKAEGMTADVKRTTGFLQFKQRQSPPSCHYYSKYQHLQMWPRALWWSTSVCCPAPSWLCCSHYWFSKRPIKTLIGPSIHSYWIRRKLKVDRCW